jgi:hypothetical protein
MKQTFMSIPSHPETAKGQPFRPIRKRLNTALRLFLFDVPYIVLLMLYAATVLVCKCNEDYFAPQLNELLRWRGKATRKMNEITYYGRVCTEADLTAATPEEITITPDMTTDDAVNMMLRHGVSIFPDLLTEETARELRETILEYNQIEDNFYVISKNYRWSYGIRVEQSPIVRQAIHEITTNPTLKSGLEGIMGAAPAIYKFHAITSVCGAAAQGFHWDVVPQKSSAMYARSFAPIYSLFVPVS